MMHVSGRGGKYRLRVAAAALGGMLAVCGAFPERAVICEAKETGAKAGQEKTVAAGEEQEVAEFVTAYFEAILSEEMETLADYVDDPEEESFRKDFLQNQVTRERGIKGWENIEVVVCPMSDGKHWLALASGDLIVEEFDVGLPGSITYLVGRNEGGELKIIISDDSVSDELIEEMRELMTSDEMVDHYNETAMAYNELIAERTDIADWIVETNNAIDEEMLEMLEEMPVGETGSGNETAGVKKDSYTVKKGDCLWNIAEEQLGDGMLWSGIYEANRAVIGEDPNLIYVGIELQLH